MKYINVSKYFYVIAKCFNRLICKNTCFWFFLSNHFKIDLDAQNKKFKPIWYLLKGTLGGCHQLIIDFKVLLIRFDNDNFEVSSNKSFNLV